jgi:hypothetical protein
MQSLSTILARGRKLLEGGCARETGAGKRKEKKEMVTDRWGQAEGMTENRRND